MDGLNIHQMKRCKDIQMRDTIEPMRTENAKMVDEMIYLDHNGSTPTHPDAIRAMMPFLTNGYGNPSSGHWAANPAKTAVEDARARIAKLVGAESSEIVLTSGATEANNMALMGLFGPGDLRGKHVITSAIEHDAVLKPVRALRMQGAKVTIVPADCDGIVDPHTVEAAITDETRLISIMTANNEVGTIQPISEIGKIAARHGVSFHTDAAQAAGKIPLDVHDLGVDFLSLAGHKFGAPNGIGALFIRKGLKLTPLFHGAGHENGRRAGTETALLAAGLGAAADVAAAKDQTHVRAMRDYFWASLKLAFGNGVVLNGHPNRRVPNTLSVSFPGHIGAEILTTMPHVAATTGSACHAGCVDMSHVLLAMGKSVEIGIGTIRFSLGSENTMAEIDAVIKALSKALK